MVWLLWESETLSRSLSWLHKLENSSTIRRPQTAYLGGVMVAQTPDAIEVDIAPVAASLVSCFMNEKKCLTILDILE